MIRMRDFEDSSGKLDWDAYHKAQEMNGERCLTCHGYIVFGPGYAQDCNSCKSLKNGDEDVSHNDLLRCPHCGKLEDVHNDHYDLFEEGEHQFRCYECDKNYLVQTRVSYSFTCSRENEE